MNILGTLTQSRYGNRHRIESIVQILTETTIGNSLHKVGVRGSHNTHIGLLHLGRANSHKLSRLQHTKQSHLRSQRQLSHLIEEYRTSVSLLEVALARVNCTRKGSLLVAKEFRIDSTLRYGTTVHRNILIVLARREGVYHLRKELLTHTAFARYEYRQIGRRNTQSNLQRPIQERGVANNSKALFYRE